MKLIAAISGCITAAVICLVTGCDHTLAGKWEYKETVRILSPDAKVEAVLIEGGAGATTSTITSVHLVSKGESVKKEDREKSVFDADHIRGFQLVWKAPKLLEIQYDEARIINFRNFWYEREVDTFRYVVEIRLSPARTNFSLPERDRNW